MRIASAVLDRRAAIAEVELQLAKLMADNDLTIAEVLLVVTRYLNTMIGYQVRDEHSELGANVE